MPVSFLAFNGRAYYLQKRVPKDLLGEYPKALIRRYLHTSQTEAKRLLPVELARLEQEFEDKRRLAKAKPLATLSETEIDRLTAIWLHDAMAQDEVFRRNGGGDADLYAAIAEKVTAAGGDAAFTPEEVEKRHFGMSQRDYLQRAETLAIVEAGAQNALARGDTSLVEFEVDDLLAREGLKLDRDSEAYRRLSYAVLKTSVKATALMLSRHQGQPVDTPPSPAKFLGAPATEGSAEHGERLSVVFERWKLERRPPAKTAGDFWAHVRRFIELHGDLGIRAITKRHVVAYKEAMLRYPSRVSGKLAGLALPALLEAVEGDRTIPRLSPRTVNDKALGALGAVFGWAVSNGYRDDNPASGVKVAMAEVRIDTRLPYSHDDLMRIFSFPIYLSGDRPKGGAGEAAKWLPLLGLFTGARLEELGQALTADCKLELGVAYLDLRVIEQGKSLKGNSSRRVIPIHPELIRCGFLDYVEARRKARDDRLFPKLASERDEVTAAWSKWWGRYARQHGISDRRKVFHSFRHTFKDACRAAGIEEAIFDTLQGHRGAGVSRSYGLGYPLSVLASAISKVSYPGLDLDHVAVARGRA